MGTLSTWDHYETFGGWPEPGEAYPDDPDALRDRIEEDRRERAAHAELLDRFGNDEAPDEPRDGWGPGGALDT